MGGQTVLLLKGEWRQEKTRLWTFVTDMNVCSRGVIMSARMSYMEVSLLVKERMEIAAEADVFLTYQWPQYMLMEDGKDALPVSICTDDDVACFMEMHGDVEQLNMCVTVVEELIEEPPGVKEASEEASLLQGEDGSESAEDFAEINLGGAEVEKGKKVDEQDSETDEENDDWHEFAYDETAGKRLSCGESSRADKLQLVVYDSGVDGDAEYFVECESNQSSMRYNCGEETLNGLFSDMENPPAMFGRDAPPVVDDILDDGMDSALEDVTYEGDGIFIGRVFMNKVDCKIKMAIHAINRKFHFRTPRSTPTHMDFVCVNTTCPWRVKAAMMDASGNFQIRKAKFTHTCPIDDRRHYHRQATTQVIGELIQTRFVAGRSGPGPIEIQRIMQDEFHVNISYWKAWRCRELAMDKAFGTVNGSFALLPSYVENLQNSNPGTVCKTEYVVDKNGCKRFKYLFISYAASIAGLKYLRPIILVDGTHLVGRYCGCLICASGQDGNFQIYPIAYGVVDSENDASYEWFFSCLQTIIPDSRRVVFISDRHSSIYSGLRKVYPSAGHGACIVHLARNVSSKFKESNLPSLMVRAAKAYTINEFTEIFAELQRVSPDCAQYLLDLGLPHWTRSYFIGERYNVMTTNVAESLNNVLKECRDFPLISMLEAIRISLNGWFVRRRASSGAETGAITPKVRDILDNNFYGSTSMKVHRINPDEFEVHNRKGDRFQVNLGTKTCTCREFEMLLIPCYHALAATSYCDVSTEMLVGEVYTTRFWCSVYEGNFHPVPTPVSTGDAVLPPIMRRPPGRPRKQRILSRGEFKRRSKSTRLCSRCLGKGHNRAACKLPVRERQQSH